jgi:hypothetical protein
MRPARLLSSRPRMPDRPALHFIGGAGAITGSKHLVQTGRSTVHVDRGLFKDWPTLRRRNWPPTFSWRELDDDGLPNPPAMVRRSRATC